jgi:hypothetical protein
MCLPLESHDARARDGLRRRVLLHTVTRANDALSASVGIHFDESLRACLTFSLGSNTYTLKESDNQHLESREGMWVLVSASVEVEAVEESAHVVIMRLWLDAVCYELREQVALPNAPFFLGKSVIIGGDLPRDWSNLSLTVTAPASDPLHGVVADVAASLASLSTDDVIVRLRAGFPRSLPSRRSLPLPLTLPIRSCSELRLWRCDAASVANYHRASIPLDIKHREVVGNSALTRLLVCHDMAGTFDHSH